MQRKEFIKVCGMCCIGALSASVLLESCGTASHYAANVYSNKQISVKKSEFFQTKNKKQIELKYVILRNEQLKFPICLFKNGDLTYNALSMECTHNSCELQAHGDYLICPCHGSEFSNTGIVQNPPAETNLKTYTIKTDNETIFIQL